MPEIGDSEFPPVVQRMLTIAFWAFVFIVSKSVGGFIGKVRTSVTGLAVAIGFGSVASFFKGFAFVAEVLVVFAGMEVVAEIERDWVVVVPVTSAVSCGSCAVGCRVNDGSLSYFNRLTEARIINTDRDNKILCSIFIGL